MTVPCRPSGKLEVCAWGHAASSEQREECGTIFRCRCRASPSKDVGGISKIVIPADPFLGVEVGSGKGGGRTIVVLACQLQSCIFHDFFTSTQ